MKTALGLAVCKISGGEQVRRPGRDLASLDRRGAGQPALLHFPSCLLSPSYPRDQREEELGEYYMKKYAKSSVGET